MISFIVPVFNNSKTIDKVINSILSQENNNLEYEIIIVNDGSTDNINLKMEQYKNNNKIKYFIKENSGVADTRNFGVEKSTGKYIIFVDGDDYISKSMLKDIEDYVNQDVDLIKWHAYIVDENGNELCKTSDVEFSKTTGEEGFNCLFGKDNYIDCLWNYAIKKDIILKFPSRAKP